jgi:acetyl-CoA carboxylase biotin carboxyl carrier protein
MAPQPSGSGAPGASTACHRYEEANVTEVKAELVGNLWKIVVEVGQAVEEDDTLMILESMKMEIPITTPTSGTVAQILVAEGEVVQEGQTVAIID